MNLRDHLPPSYCDTQAPPVKPLLRIRGSLGITKDTLVTAAGEIPKHWVRQFSVNYSREQWISCTHIVVQVWLWTQPLLWSFTIRIVNFLLLTVSSTCNSIQIWRYKQVIMFASMPWKAPSSNFWLFELPLKGQKQVGPVFFWSVSNTVLYHQDCKSYMAVILRQVKKDYMASNWVHPLATT